MSAALSEVILGLLELQTCSQPTAGNELVFTAREAQALT